MAATNEAGVVRQILKAVKKHYPRAWVMKVHGGPYQMTGVPDLLLCVEGVLIGAEVKFQRPGESRDGAASRATPGQRLQIRNILASGGMAGVVTSADEALQLIERGLRHHGARDHDV